MKVALYFACGLYILASCQSAAKQDANNSSANAIEKESTKQEISASEDSSTHVAKPDTSDNVEDSFVAIPNVELSYTQRSVPANIIWKSVGKGLKYSEIDLPMKCNVGDSKVSILKIDPDSATINLATSKSHGNVGRRADEWLDSLGWRAVVNAGMFNLDDMVTCTGFMKVDGVYNNPRLSKAYNLIAAFNPKNKSDPLFKIIDLGCENWDDWKDKYDSYVQGIRVANYEGNNTWGKQEKFWSMVLLGEDRSGNALFLFTRTPYRVYDFSKMLLALPLELENIMYLEGGPEACLQLQTKSLQVSKMGSYETDFNERDNNMELWNIPNVIYVK